MKNLSDYIPLIIIIASFIFSAITNSKKKGKKVTEKTLLPGESSRQNPPQETSSPVFAPVEKLQPNKKKIQQLLSEQTRQPIEKKQETPLSKTDSLLVEIMEEPNLLQLDISDREELKRAVIYSEILQRKEY